MQIRPENASITNVGVGQPDQADRPSLADQTDQTKQVDQAGGANQSDQPCQVDQPNQLDKVETADEIDPNSQHAAVLRQIASDALALMAEGEDIPSSRRSSGCETQ